MPDETISMDEEPEVERCPRCGELMQFEEGLVHEVEREGRKLHLLNLSGHRCTSCEYVGYDERSEGVIDRAEKGDW